MKTISVLATRWESRNKMQNEIRLSISGSRTLNDERVKIIILEQIEKHKATRLITHAEPEGVCKVARELCKEKAIPLTLHYLNFQKLRGAFYHRTLSVFYDSDYALFVHDGKSKGCQNEYEVAKKMLIPSEYYQLDIPKQTKSVGFEIKDNEWLDLDIPDIEFVN